MAILNLNNQTFQREVIEQKLPVIVEFGAEWCGSCHIIDPGLQQLARDYHGSFIFTRVNVDQMKAVKNQYEIAEIPTLLFFENGTVVDAISGTVPMELIRNKIEAILKPKTIRANE